MKIQLLYFGQIADKVQIKQEVIHVNENCSIGTIKKTIIEKYPALEKQVFKMALNQNFVNDEESVTMDCEIALLPPFAGG